MTKCNRCKSKAKDKEFVVVYSNREYQHHQCLECFISGLKERGLL